MLSFNYKLSSNNPTVIQKWREYATSSNNELQEHMQTWLDDKNNNKTGEEDEDVMIMNNKIQIHHLDVMIPRSSKFYAERSCTQSSYRYLLPVSWIYNFPPNNKEDNNNDDENDIDQVKEWCKYMSARGSASKHRQHQPRDDFGEKLYESTPAFIKRLKRALKAIESETVPNRRIRRQEEANRKNNNDNDEEVDGTTTTNNSSSNVNDHELSSSKEVSVTNNDIRLAHGRFGQLWRKQKLCWSNFAHPTLTGMSSSPSYEAVWRTMDRARIVGYLIDGEEENTNNVNDDDMHIILEFKADGFVMGQIPRIVASIVAMTNGWLPQHFFEIACRPDVYLPAPPAPPLLEKKMYFEAARYHFHELTGNANGRTNDPLETFAKTIRTGSKVEETWEGELQKKLFSGGSSSDDNISEMEAEQDWLHKLRDDISPDLRRQIIETVEADERLVAEHSTATSSEHQQSSSVVQVDSDAPTGSAYSTTLGLLRHVVESGSWPATSDARSRVIKTITPLGTSSSSQNVIATKKRKAIVSAFPGKILSAGSFTVVNEQIWESGSDNESSLPMANALFPELTKAVFDLEAEIIRETNSPLPAADGMNKLQSDTPIRRPSTHCAVNRNGKFAS